jgi:hypothetical protein
MDKVRSQDRTGYLAGNFEASACPVAGSIVNEHRSRPPNRKFRHVRMKALTACRRAYLLGSAAGTEARGQRVRVAWMILMPERRARKGGYPGADAGDPDSALAPAFKSLMPSIQITALTPERPSTSRSSSTQRRRSTGPASVRMRLPPMPAVSYGHLVAIGLVKTAAQIVGPAVIAV